MVRGISHLHLCATLPGNKIKHPIGHRDIKSSNIILGGSCVRGSIMVNQWPFLTAVWFPSVNAQTNFCCCNWPIRSISAADAMWFSHIVAWTIFLELTHFDCYLYIFFQSSFDNVVTAEGNFISKHELLLLFYRWRLSSENCRLQLSQDSEYFYFEQGRGSTTGKCSYWSLIHCYFYN